MGAARDLEGRVRRPGIDRREILPASDLWNVAEDVEPERVVATEERALTGAQMIAEPERDPPLTPCLPRGIGCEARLHAEPGGKADGHEGERGDRHGGAPHDLAPAHALDRPRERYPDANREGRVQLERVADRLRRDADPEELLEDEDRAENEQPKRHDVHSGSQPFEWQRRDRDDRDERYHREREIRGCGVAASWLREGAHEAEAVPTQREENGQHAELPKAGPLAGEARRRTVAHKPCGGGQNDPDNQDPEIRSGGKK